MAPFSFPRSTKILPKTDPKRRQCFDRFWDGFFIRFSSNLGPNLEPCWPLFRTKWGGRPGKVFLFLVAFIFFPIFSRGKPGVPHRGAPQNRWGTPPGLAFWTHIESVFNRFVIHFASFAALVLASILALFTCSFSKLSCWLKDVFLRPVHKWTASY